MYLINIVTSQTLGATKRKYLVNRNSNLHKNIWKRYTYTLCHYGYGNKARDEGCPSTLTAQPSHCTARYHLVRSVLVWRKEELLGGNGGGVSLLLFLRLLFFKT